MDFKLSPKTHLHSLLRYHRIALLTWLLPVLVVAVGLFSLPRLGTVMANPTTTVSSVILIFVALVLPTNLRMSVLIVRDEVFSVAVAALRCATKYGTLHLWHGLAGAVMGVAYVQLMGWAGAGGEDVDARVLMFGLVAAVCGFVFSVKFVLQKRFRVQFPTLQQRRLRRVGDAFAPCLYMALCDAAASMLVALPIAHVLLGAVVDVVAWIGGGTGLGTVVHTPQATVLCVNIASRCLALGWFVHTCFRLSEALHEIVLTEARALKESTFAELTQDNEVDVLLAALEQCDKGSLEEAFQMLPLKLDGVGLLRTMSRSSILEFAYVVVGKSKRMGSDCGKEILQWWTMTIQTIASNPMHTPWQQLVELAERRRASVLQAIYTNDAKEPGKAFWGRTPMGAKAQIIRARAFLDLATMTEHDAARTRAMISALIPAGSRRSAPGKVDSERWLRLVSVVTSSVDVLTTGLQVAVRMKALEPTLPIDDQGRSQAEAFVLGPSPREMESLSPEERRVLAWHAEDAARTYRLRPWVSAGWWNEVLWGQFREHDPVSVQRSLMGNLQDQGGNNVQDKARAPTADLTHHSGLNDQHRQSFLDPARSINQSGKLSQRSRGASWEEQWKRQEQDKMTNWGKGLLELLQRSSAAQTDALFADDEVVVFAIDAISRLATIDGVLEHELGVIQQSVPTILCSLLLLREAIVAYEQSPVFLGAKVAPTYLEGNQVVRPVVMKTKYATEAAIYRITSKFNRHLADFALPEACVKALRQFLEYDV